jgi:putative component of toxin-antitoxin plasmid stabilization module
MHEIRHYLTTEGKDPVLEWLKQLRDPIAKTQIITPAPEDPFLRYGDEWRVL